MECLLDKWLVETVVTYAELQKREHKTLKATEAKLTLLKRPWDQKEVQACLVCMCRGNEIAKEMLAMTHVYF